MFKIGYKSHNSTGRNAMIHARKKRGTYIHVYIYEFQQKVSKAIPVTGRGGPQGCETSRLPYFLDNRITGDGEVVSLTRRPPYTARKIPDTRFCYRLSRHQGHSAPGRITINKKSNVTRNRTRDFPACRIIPQPTTLPRTHLRSRISFIEQLLLRISWAKSGQPWFVCVCQRKCIK
jgi:hypothetical protein